MTTPVIARRWTNWGGNQQAHATEVLTPGTVDEVAAQVKEASGSGRRIKAVGSGHSFTSIAVADDQRLFLHRLAGLVSIDGSLVTVQAGMPLHVLNAVLAEHGLAMPNLGDIDQQTVAGAISTGTHGTGAEHSTLASCVEAVKLVTGSGEVLEVGKDDPIFPAARLGLGALGVLVEVTLRCVDAFTLLADERPIDHYRGRHLEAHFDRVEVVVDGVRVDLTRRELALLRFLVTHTNRVLGRADLLGHAWHNENDGRSRTVDVHIRRLRVKLGAAGQQIQTVPRVGYRFSED